MSPTSSAAVILAALLVCAVPALAHHDDDIPKIVIYPAEQVGSLTVPSVRAQEKALEQTAGSVAFVDSEKFKNEYANTLRDVLSDTPGVLAETRYGQELRLSIRGSGVARGFHARGVEILQDGIPNNLADGSGDYYQIDPLSLRSVEVYKGGNGLAYGSSTLGGAVNFVTPTAYTAIAPTILRLDTGSFGTVRPNLQFSRIDGDVDYLFNGTMTHADGYRTHSATQSEAFNANMGYKLSNNAETRFYLGSFVVDQELPGALTLSDALHNPTKASAAALSGDQARDSRTQRIANRSSFNLGSGKLDIDTWGIHKSLFHPIFQVIDQDGWTYGFAPRYTATFNPSGYRNDFIGGARFFGGNNQALQFTNVNGSRGAQTLNARQDAYNYEAYFENRFWFLPDVALMTGAKLFHNERIYNDLGGLAGNPTPKSASKAYDGINPKLGFLWEPQQNVQLFTNVTRSQDVPDFTDLTQTTATTTRFVPLKPQEAITIEVGSRGTQGRYAWDVTAYRSWLRHELLQFTTNASIPATTFNARDTLHQGLEIGGSVDLAHDLISVGGDKVSLSQLWNYSDFHFESDPQYGNNQIAGVPEHVLRTELTYKNHAGFYISPIVDWAPTGAYADQANTLRAPSYVLLGLQTGMQITKELLFYVDARNLTGERYISDISTITDARVVASTAIFYPGEGRSVFAGIRYAF
ncbi:MAG: TonB-dependent receptor [Alphaproteobacteria bacterium]